MIDVDKCVKEYTDGLTDLNKEQKEKFSEMATAMGNFLNCIWKQKEVANGECRNDSESCTENQPKDDKGKTD